MSDQSNKEIDIVMSLYNEGKITERQRDDLLSALGYDKKADSSDKKTIRGKFVTFAIGGMNKADGEEASRLCGELCNELRDLDGVRSVKVYREDGKTRAYVKGDFDVGDVMAQGSSMGYVMQPIKFADDDEDDDLPDDDDFPDDDDLFCWDDDEDDEDDEDDDDDEDDEDDDDDDENGNGKSGGKLWSDISDLGEKISQATLKGINAAKNIGIKISKAVNDAMLTTAINGADISIKDGDNMVIHIRHEDNAKASGDINVSVVAKGANGNTHCFDTAENVESIKEKCRPVLSDEMFAALTEMLDKMVGQRYIGSFNYSKNGENVKVSVSACKRGRK